ncbi:sulfatase-like hydrolase/transferase [Oligoflexia bacterium]|nr:sulfatase-like hydrolase/transferase [Oligoflexia bacterium]
MNQSGKISIIIAIVVIVLIACGVVFLREEPEAASGAAAEVQNQFPNSNVVVILIDTLRADHLASYGYAKNTAPFLNKLAKKGVVFENPFSTSSTTAPSTASIYTSRYPSEHGVIIGQIAMRHLLKEHPQLTLNRIPEELTILPEVFKNAGYSTFAVNDNLNISKEMGYAQGYDKFETYRYKGAEVINNKLKEWKKDITASEKYFVYIHYMEPHEPYRKQKPWFKKAGNKLGNTINAYDSEISYLDSKIEEMFKLFGWEEDTLVVITSDHGEEFNDHGGKGHGKTLYTEVIHVPLIIYHPKLKSQRVKEYVSTLDVLPTLARLVGLTEDPSWRGLALTPLLKNGLLSERMFFSQLLRKKEHQRSSKASVISDNWHYIKTKKLSGEQLDELYDLKDDFHEKSDKAVELPQMVGDLGERIAELESGSLALPQQEVSIEMDEERLEQLKTLGYME